MAAITVFLGLISGTGLTIAAIIWYSTLFTSFQFSRDIVQDFDELIDNRSHSISGANAWRRLANALPQRELLMFSSSTRGSEELMNAQIEITKNLVASHKVNFIALDTDWHQIHPLNLYVLGLEFDHLRANEVISRSQLWPQWIIANHALSIFLDWLRDYNQQREWQERVSLFGMGLNSPKQAIELLTNEVKSSHEISTDLIKLKSCLNFEVNTFEAYARSTAQGGRTCEQEALELLLALESSEDYFKDRYDYATYNIFELARLIVSAEQYYQHLHSNPKKSWNAKSYHQGKSVLRLMKRKTDKSKMAVIWGHHSVLANTLLPEMEHSGYITSRDHILDSLDRLRTYTIGLIAFEGEVIASRGFEQEPLIFNLSKPDDDTLEGKLWSGAAHPYYIPLYESDLRQNNLATLVNYRVISDVVNFEGQKEFYSPVILPDLFDEVIIFPKVTALKTLTPTKKATD
jgi:erythromycin esterase-like protein